MYRRVLREELAGSELEALAHEHQIEMNRERCVLTFQILQTETETAFNMLEELVPRAGGDLLVEMDRHTVVFLKSMENVESFDELFQLAEAIEQTLLDEAGKSCVVGIGRTEEDLPGDRRELSRIPPRRRSGSNLPDRAAHLCVPQPRAGALPDGYSARNGHALSRHSV